jgi:UDP-N-acetyl-D-glucosamine dehydrogenase
MKNKIVSVVGLGYVGLPTACVIANCKNKKLKNIYKVNGIDKNLNDVKANILESKLFSKILSEDKNLTKSLSKSVANNKINFSKNINTTYNSDVIIVSINFEFDKNKKLSNFDNLKNLFFNIGKVIKKDALILIQTTLPPGTCDHIIIPSLKKILKKRKMKLSDIFLSYSYERVMPGKEYMKSITDNYRCYSGMNKSSLLVCKKFLKTFINYKKFPLFKFSKIIDCETAKILENSYRAINIAFIDEWTKFSNLNSINLNRIINAIKKRKTHNNIMRPGLGMGGYCLTKDPDFINFSSQFLMRNKLKFPIIDASSKINKKMPQTSLDFIKARTKNLKEKKILIMGISYKEDVSDLRSSPSVDLINFLKKITSKITLHDPITSKYNDMKLKILKKIPNFNKFDLVLFCVNHSFYKKLGIKKFSKKTKYFDLNQVLKQSLVDKMKKENFKLEILGGNY